MSDELLSGIGKLAHLQRNLVVEQWRRSKRPWRRIGKHIRAWFTVVRGLGILLLVGTAALVYRNYGLDWPRLEADFFANIITDLIGIVFPVLVLDTLTEQRIVRERKRAIIQQIGSPVKDAALEAVRIAKIEGWLEDGSLEKAFLGHANLEGATLREVNFQEATLWCANLEGATLGEANLQGAFLQKANLQGAGLGFSSLEDATLNLANLRRADLMESNLQGARLSNAILEEAILWGTNLQGAHLTGANLQGARLLNTRFNEDTILPDGSKWVPDTDLSRFTDPNHPNFWRSDDQFSPACRGKESQLQETASPEKKPRKRSKKSE